MKLVVVVRYIVLPFYNLQNFVCLIFTVDRRQSVSSPLIQYFLRHCKKEQRIKAKFSGRKTVKTINDSRPKRNKIGKITTSTLLMVHQTIWMFLKVIQYSFARC